LITGARRASYTTVSESPAEPVAAMLRPRNSSSPVPFAPPFGLVLLMAPAGAETSRRLPGANMAAALRRSSSSVSVAALTGKELTFLTVTV
jgi:hypothetical protein